jgi:hypothetical protein
VDNYEEFKANCVNERYARRVWKIHTEKNGNVPMIVKCAICSGEEQKIDIKLGRYRPKRPSKRLRDENTCQ